MEGLFDSEHEFELETIESIEIKLKPRDAGQIDSQVHLTVWPAALEMCRQSHTFMRPGCKVLELGAGTGLLGIYIKKNFDCDVTITDGNTESVELIQENAERNGASVRAEVLVWGNQGPDCDIIVGSDIVYSKNVIRNLVSTIKQGLGQSGICYIANHFIRFGNLQKYFLEICDEFQINVTEVKSLSNEDVVVISLSNL